MKNIFSKSMIYKQHDNHQDVIYNELNIIFLTARKKNIKNSICIKAQLFELKVTTILKQKKIIEILV